MSNNPGQQQTQPDSKTIWMERLAFVLAEAKAVSLATTKFIVALGGCTATWFKAWRSPPEAKLPGPDWTKALPSENRDRVRAGIGCFALLILLVGMLRPSGQQATTRYSVASGDAMRQLEKLRAVTDPMPLFEQPSLPIPPGNSDASFPKDDDKRDKPSESSKTAQPPSMNSPETGMSFSQRAAAIFPSTTDGKEDISSIFRFASPLNSKDREVHQPPAGWIAVNESSYSALNQMKPSPLEAAVLMWRLWDKTEPGPRGYTQYYWIDGPNSVFLNYDEAEEFHTAVIVGELATLSNAHAAKWKAHVDAGMLIDVSKTPEVLSRRQQSPKLTDFRPFTCQDALNALELLGATFGHTYDEDGLTKTQCVTRIEEKMWATVFPETRRLGDGFDTFANVPYQRWQVSCVDGPLTFHGNIGGGVVISTIVCIPQGTIPIPLTSTVAEKQSQETPRPSHPVGYRTDNVPSVVANETQLRVVPLGGLPRGKRRFSKIAFFPDGKTLLAAGKDNGGSNSPGMVLLVDAATGEIELEMGALHDWNIAAIAVAQNSPWFATLGRSDDKETYVSRGKVNVWRHDQPGLVCSLDLHEEGGMWGRATGVLAFGSTDNTLYFGGTAADFAGGERFSGSVAKVWNVDQRKETLSFTESDWERSKASAPLIGMMAVKDNLFLTFHRDGSVMCWSNDGGRRSGNPLERAAAGPRKAGDVPALFSKNGEYAALFIRTPREATLVVIDSAGKTRQTRISPFEIPENSGACSLSDDGKFFATFDPFGDGAVVWNTFTGALCLQCPMLRASDMAISTKGQFLAATCGRSGDQSELFVWKIEVVH
jgi:hypothetical protein